MGLYICLHLIRESSISYLDWVCRCGVLTIEIEHVDVATLEKLEQQGVDCQPKASTIRIIQVFILFHRTIDVKSVTSFKSLGSEITTHGKSYMYNLFAVASSILFMVLHNL